MTNIWAIVPVKPLNRSKSRLAPVLDIDQREAFSREMFEKTLKTLTKVKSISGILVVSRDTGALALARGYEVQTLQESGAPELNASLARATQAVTDLQANGVLIVASDIPLMQADDLEKMIALADKPPTMVIATDRRQSGTNVLLVRPAGLFPYAYGEGSFEKHVEAAEQAGAEIHIFESANLALDVDTPEDLDVYRERLMAEKTNEPAWPTGL